MKDTKVLSCTQEKSDVGRRNFVDAFHGWDSMNLEVIGARSWQKRTIPLDIHQDWPVLLDRIWKLALEISGRKSTNGSDAMMRYVMKHASLEWRATNVHAGSGTWPTNNSNMRRRMTGAKTTN